MSATSEPTYAYTHDGEPTPLDRIVERKGPYLKVWCARVVFVEPYLTKRDLATMQERRAMIYRCKEGNWQLLDHRDGKPVWIKAHVSPMRFA